MQPTSKIGWMNSSGRNSLIASASLPKPFKSFEVSKIEIQLQKPEFNLSSLRFL